MSRTIREAIANLSVTDLEAQLEALVAEQVTLRLKDRLAELGKQQERMLARERELATELEQVRQALSYFSEGKEVLGELLGSISKEVPEVQQPERSYVKNPTLGAYEGYVPPKPFILFEHREINHGRKNQIFAALTCRAWTGGVFRFPDAYSTIMEVIENHTGKTIPRGSIHALLKQLDAEGVLEFKEGGEVVLKTGLNNPLAHMEYKRPGS